MKKPVASLIRLLIGAVLGFIAGSAAVKIMSGTERSSATRKPDSAVPTLGGTDPVIVPSGEESKALPSAKDFREMPAHAKLELAAGFGSLTPVQREAFLKECADWPEPESTRMLRLLLSRWAETDPGAASEWAFRHLEGRALDCFDDVAQIWAARDGQGLAAWSHDALTKGDLPYSDGIRVRTPRALEHFHPVALAEFLALDCNKGFSYNGIDFSRTLRTPEAVKAMAAKLPGHVGYISDLEELNRQLNGKSSNPRNMAVKNGWNALFEQTAVAFHRISPQECNAWLRTFPENAQLIARHEIASAAEPLGNK